MDGPPSRTMPVVGHGELRHCAHSAREAMRPRLIGKRISTTRAWPLGRRRVSVTCMRPLRPPSRDIRRTALLLLVAVLAAGGTALAGGRSAAIQGRRSRPPATPSWTRRSTAPPAGQPARESAGRAVRADRPRPAGRPGGSRPRSTASATTTARCRSRIAGRPLDDPDPPDALDARPTAPPVPVAVSVRDRDRCSIWAGQGGRRRPARRPRDEARSRARRAGRRRRRAGRARPAARRAARAGLCAGQGDDAGRDPAPAPGRARRQLRGRDRAARRSRPDRDHRARGR